MTSPDAVWSLETRHLGRRVHVYHRLDSTNTFALSLGHDPSHHGLTLLARQQSSGRGQYGRTWQAPPGSSVLMSVLLFLPAKLRRPPLLTAWAAVAVCETIARLTSLDAQIKWPNDILVVGHKVCGILIEQRTTGHDEFPLATTLGVGLNLTQSARMFEEAGLPFAGSLQMLSGIALNHEVAAKELICQLDDDYDRLLQDDGRTLEAQWRDRLGLLGEIVVVEGINQHHVGRLTEVSLTGITIETDTGEVVRLAPEAVRHLDAVEA